MCVILSTVRNYIYNVFSVCGCCNPVCRYGTGSLTSHFVDRIFQECLTYEGEVVSDLETVHNIG